MRRLAAVLCALPVSMFALGAPSAPPEPFITLKQGIKDPIALARQTSISRDGRFVAFVSRAALVGVDTRGYPHVYVLDRQSGQVTLESGAPDGCQPGHACGLPRLSGDGRFLTFETTEESRVPGGPPFSMILLRDRRTGTTRPIAPAGTSQRDASISADGRLVVFASSATTLAPGVDANGTGEDVYSFDIATGAIRRLSVDSAGRQPPTGVSFAPAVSGDGRYVAFTSSAPLDAIAVRATPRPMVSVFLRDTVLGRTTRISVRADGSVPNGSSYGAAINGDGRYVAFVSEASDLVKADGNRASDVFLFDAQKGSLSLVSRNNPGRTANGGSGQPAISADGRLIVFQSDASDLACGGRCVVIDRDINLVSDIFASDQASGAMWRVSTGRSPWMEPSVAPAIDGTGSVIAFSSLHPCHAEDDADDYDLFVGGMNKGTGATSK